MPRAGRLVESKGVFRGSIGAGDAEAAQSALREAAMAAHEEELRRALIPLEAAFQRWRASHRFGSSRPLSLAARPCRSPWPGDRVLRGGGEIVGPQAPRSGQSKTCAVPRFAFAARESL